MRIRKCQRFFKAPLLLIKEDAINRKYIDEQHKKPKFPNV